MTSNKCTLFYDMQENTRQTFPAKKWDQTKCNDHTEKDSELDGNGERTERKDKSRMQMIDVANFCSLLQ